MREYTRLETECRYNKGVLCEENGRCCERCGWNPKECRRRKENTRDVYRKKGKGWVWIWKQL